MLTWVLEISDLDKIELGFIIVLVMVLCTVTTIFTDSCLLANYLKKNNYLKKW